jgi:phage tail-like protein
LSGDAYDTAAGSGIPIDSVFMPSIGHGFGTLRVRPPGERQGPPPSASARGYLRTGLPEIYQDSDFAMRFVGALETLLDPIVALLDALPAHFSADLAPADVLVLITGWLGIELREDQPTAERREVVRHAMELNRLRGTRAGLELGLGLAFPGVPFRVEDPGAVVWASSADALPTPAAPSFVVYCDVPLATERAAAAARLIEQLKPAHVGYRLRVKAPKKPPPTE